MKLIAHRGGAGLRVENTLAAFATALELGADGAELDVHLTRDGQVVVHHDATLNGAYCRGPDVGWIRRGERVAIADLSYDEIRRYEIGIPNPRRRYARVFDRVAPAPEQRIPLLGDVIRLVRSRSRTFVLVVELKSPLLDAARRPWLALVDRTLAVAGAEDFLARTVLCSFDWGSLVYARRRCPGIATWFTTPPLSWFAAGRPPPEDIPMSLRDLRALRAAYRGGAAWFAGFDPRFMEGGYPGAIAAAGGMAWQMFHRDCTGERVRALAELGLKCAVWSSNLRDTPELKRLVRTGAEYFVLDYPDVKLDAIAGEGTQ